MGKRTPAVINQAEERQRLLESVRRSVAKNPYLSIAFGLYWMQTTLLFQSPYLFLEPSPLVGFPLPKGTVLLVASVAAYLIWSLLHRRINLEASRILGENLPEVPRAIQAGAHRDGAAALEKQPEPIPSPTSPLGVGRIQPHVR